jgi:hypothetical protein
MALKIPMVLNAGQQEQIQSGDYVDPTALGTNSGGAAKFLREDGDYKYIGGLSSIAAASGAINSASGETVITQTPALPANYLQAGTTIRITFMGTCTSSSAQTQTFAIRIGTAGTTSDGLMFSGTNISSAASGTNIPFKLVLELTVRTTGSSATCYAHYTLVNQGTTGISAAAATIQTGTVTSFNTTTANNIISATYKANAVGPACNFQQSFIEIIKN